jgi:hypothetical protein
MEQDQVRQFGPSEYMYGPWRIHHDPLPVYLREARNFDWSYAHQDYDGPPEDKRCGRAASLHEAVEQIKAYEIEES